MKRIIASLGAVAMVAAAVTPAAAFGWHFGGSDTLSNFAKVNTSMNVYSNTGMNSQKNFGGVGGSLWGGSTVEQGNVGQTGAALATGAIQTEANNNTGCNCFDDVENKAFVTTNMTVHADTGMNSQMNIGGTFKKGSLTQGNMLGTGDAAAQGQIFTIVNSNYQPE